MDVSESLRLLLSSSMWRFISIISEFLIPIFSSLSWISPINMHDLSYCWTPLASFILRSFSSSDFKAWTSALEKDDALTSATSANFSFNNMFSCKYSWTSWSRSWTLIWAILAWLRRSSTSISSEPRPTVVVPWVNDLRNFTFCNLISSFNSQFISCSLA